MLKKSQRLNLSTPQDNSIFKSPSLTIGNLRVFYRGSEGGEFRAAVMVPKKRVPTAAMRNSVRRSVYNTIKDSDIRLNSTEILLLFVGSSEASKDISSIKENAKEALKKIKKILQK